MVRVDEAKCREVAQLLRDAPIPEDREDTSLPDLERERLPDFLLMAVAICYQTTPASGAPPLEGEVDGRWTRGWDYLLRKLATAARSDSRWTQPAMWIHTHADDLQRATHDEQLGARLTDAEGRAALIRDLGETMRARAWNSATDIYGLCQGRVRASEPCLVTELARFRAYSDPVIEQCFSFSTGSTEGAAGCRSAEILCS